VKMGCKEGTGLSSRKTWSGTVYRGSQEASIPFVGDCL
jgi:hypothetical protein